MATICIPEKCRVLVIGGGPGGSYAASALAREDIDTVLLESDTMPRYHIGESTLPSFRHYLQFIDLHKKFDDHGFTIKVGGAFKMNPQNREGFTDFRASGEENRAWNLVRSEADELMFRHAGESGAKIFEGVKVESLQFDGQPPEQNGAGSSNTTIGRPVSATWKKKSDGTTGVIKFEYVVDASGRAGLLSNKYLKNRAFSKALKNVANWAYFSGGGIYGKGTRRENSPLFEALSDESGWVWYIPLHNGTHSIGVVRNQDIAATKKREARSTQKYFEESLKLAPMVTELLSEAKQASELRSAADFSYHAKTYAIPYARIVGDAGCFIDPFFSSGIHLAMTAALSATTTICASIRGDCDEVEMVKWHTQKVREAYARFLLVVLGTYQQMRNQKQPVLSEVGEDNFDRAFGFFQPVIQGTADSTKAFTQADLNKSVSFMTRALGPIFKAGPEENGDGAGEKGADPQNPGSDLVGVDDEEALQALRGHHLHDTAMGLDKFTTDIINGLVPKLERGSLTLVPAVSST